VITDLYSTKVSEENQGALKMGARFSTSQREGIPYYFAKKNAPPLTSVSATPSLPRS